MINLITTLNILVVPCLFLKLLEKSKCKSLVMPIRVTLKMKGNIKNMRRER